MTPEHIISLIDREIHAHDGVAIVTSPEVAPLIDSLYPDTPLSLSPRCILPSGEDHKTISAAIGLCSQWLARGLSRRSLIIAVGGGLVTDVAGFAASVYMRGIDCICLSTTLLGAVDAAIGGKTAVNLDGVKNVVGTFSLPLHTLFDTRFFASLPHDEVLSGMGEIVKTAYIAPDAALLLPRVFKALSHIPSQMPPADIIARCREVKQAVVDADLHESGLRRILNFGHTAGHAFEALYTAHGQRIAHGTAVVWGIAVALILSSMKGMPTDTLYRFRDNVAPHFPRPDLDCAQYDTLLHLMAHDKKASAQTLRFVLLHEPGRPYTASVTPDEVREAFDLYRELAI